MERMEGACTRVRDSLILLQLIGKDFENAGKCKNDEGLRNTVATVEAACAAFVPIFEQRELLIERRAQRSQLEMVNELDELARKLREARENKSDKK